MSGIRERRDTFARGGAAKPCIPSLAPLETSLHFVARCGVLRIPSLALGVLRIRQAAILLMLLLSLPAACGAVCLKQPAAANEAATRRSAQQVHKYVLERRKAIADFVRAMPPEKRAAELFLVNINGDSDFRPVETPLPGGYLFFRYNIAHSPQGVKDFTASIRAWAEKHAALPPYLAVDQEGGDVERLRAVASPLPSAKEVALGTADGALALYRNQGRQMREMGFHLNLAPIAETLNERNRDVLQSRSYGSAADVVRFGEACIKGYQAQGISCAIKHFPLTSSSDPHTTQSEVVISKDGLAAEAAPFMRLISCGADAVIMSHAAINGLPPASLSEHWINEIRQAGFHGLVISDDIFMAAVDMSPEQTAVRAVAAGADVIMLSEKRFALPLAAIVEAEKRDSAFARRVAESAFRVVLFKLHHGILSYGWSPSSVLRLNQQGVS